MAAPVKIFHSYAHADHDLHLELWKHLTGLERGGLIERWDDRVIQGGEDWDKEIKAKLSEAEIILLEVTASFVDSKYCWGIEMTKALQRHHAKCAVVIPVFLKHYLWEDLPFASLQRLPSGSKSIEDRTDRNVALAEVAKGVKDVAQGIRQSRSSARAAPAGSMTGASPIEREFHRIDFEKIRTQFLADLNQFGRDAGVLLYLLDQCDALGGEWCVESLRSELNSPRRFHVDFCGAAPATDDLRRRLGEYVEAPMADAGEIVRKIAGGLRNGSHLLFDLRMAEADTQILDWFEARIWRELAAELKARELAMARLVAIVSVGAQSEDHPCYGRLRLSPWTEEDLRNWLEEVGVDASRKAAEARAKSLFRRSNGYPDTVRKLLLKELP